MKNIYLIPTDKPSRLRYNLSNVLVLTKESYKDYSKLDNIHIFITSDDEIKEGDWIYYTSALGFCKTTIGSNGLEQEGIPAKKIILTTDGDLIKDGIQAIDDEFLEWFVKNPSCEYVEVKENLVVTQDKPLIQHQGSRQIVVPHKIDYNIIIPQEEPKQTVEQYEQQGLEKYAYEFQQETLEEAYQRGYERGLNALIPLIENLQSEITKLKRNL